MTTGIAARDAVDKDTTHGDDDVVLAVAKLNALARREDAVLVELKPRWRLTDEEIMRASVAVIFVALVTVIGVAASAILTMG